METPTVKGQLRKHAGTRRAQELRKQGQLPGIIYGHGEEPVMFSVDRHELEVELLHRHRLLSLDLQGTKKSYLIREVQYNHLGSEPVHLDLMRVDMNEVIRVQVAVELVGTPKAAGHSGILEHGLNTILVECLASNIPDVIKARVSDLEVGQAVTVSQLELPAGVRAITAGTEVVATLRAMAAEVEAAAEPAAEGEARTEPEVISKGKAEEEEEA
jgi:large subunit ribosomal protein L25